MNFLKNKPAQAFMLLFFPLLFLFAGCSQMEDIFKTKQGSIVVAASELAELNDTVKADLVILEKRLDTVAANKYTPAQLAEFRIALDSFGVAHTQFNAAIGKGGSGKVRVQNMLGFYTGYAKAKAAYLRARPYLKAPDRQLRLIDANFKTVDKALMDIYVLVGAGGTVEATAGVRLFLRTLDIILRAT